MTKEQTLQEIRGLIGSRNGIERILHMLAETIFEIKESLENLKTEQPKIFRGEKRRSGRPRKIRENEI